MSIKSIIFINHQYSWWFFCGMKFSKKAITEFIEIYKLEYGIDLSDDEAQTVALNFLSLIKAIYLPMKKGGIHGNKS